jgi:hypothetical protein
LIATAALVRLTRTGYRRVALKTATCSNRTAPLRAPPSKPLKQSAALIRAHHRLPLAVVKYRGLARRHLMPPRSLMRPLLNSGTLGMAVVSAALRTTTVGVIRA